MSETNPNLPFRLVHAPSGQTTAILELPADVDAFLAEVIDPDTMSLAVDGGKGYTLVPIEDGPSNMLRSVYDAFHFLDSKPTRYITILQDRQDGLVKAVESMFSKQSRVLIGSKSELAEYIAFQRGGAKAFEPRVAERHIMGDLVKFLDERSAESEGCE